MLLDAELTRRALPTEKISSLLLLVGFFLIKIFKVSSVFTIFDALSGSQISLAVLLFFAFALSSLYFLITEKPWKLSLKTDQWITLIGYSVTLLLHFITWTIVLEYYGPLKTLLAIDYSEVAIVFVLESFVNFRGIKSRGVIGSILLLLAYTFLIFSGSYSSLLLEKGDSRFTSSRFVLPSHFVAGLSLLATIFLGIVRKRMSKRLRRTEPLKTHEKATTAFATCITTIILAPVAFYESFLSSGSNEVGTWGFGHLLFSIIFIVSIFMILDYHTEHWIRKRISSISLTKAGLLSQFVASLLYEGFASFSVSFSFFNFLICALFVSAHHLLLSNKRKDSDDLDDTLLPMSGHQRPHGSHIHVGKSFNLNGLSATVSQVLGEIWANSTSRKIFLFMLVNFAFMFVELAYGFWTNSLGLITDAFHMLFDCTALGIGLYAEVMSKWKANRVFTFGFGRVEVLAGYLNGIFLCFISFSIFAHSLVRMWTPPDVTTDRLLLISFLGLVVNLIGIFAFHDFDVLELIGLKKKKENDIHDHHGHSHHGHDCGHDHHSDNLYGIFLHILADALGSVSVIISSILISLFGWNIVDPICSLLISVLIFASVIPLLKSSVGVLMQSTPSKFVRSADKILQSISSIPGVSTCSNYQFWAYTPDNIVGSLQIQVAPQAQRQLILRAAKQICQSNRVNDVTLHLNAEGTSTFNPAMFSTQFMGRTQ